MTQTQTQTPQPVSFRRDALVDIERPGRWAKQLASHLGRKLAVTETARGPQVRMEVEEGSATCLFDTSDEARLGLHVESTSQATAERLAHVVGSHLERFAEKEGVQVSWT